MTMIKRGRPSDYTLELAKEICDAISSTSLGLKALCNKHEHWPCPDTIYSWLCKHKEFSDMYAQSKRMQVEVLVDEILEISDDISQDTVIDDAGKTSINYEHINRTRLRVDTRKWIACKLVPRVYGDRVANSHAIEADEQSKQQSFIDIRNAMQIYKMDK